MFYNLDQGKRTIETNIPMMRSPSEYNLNFTEHFFNTSDGKIIHSWLILTNDSKVSPTIIYLHGREGNIGHRLFRLNEIVRKLHVNVFIFDYRGFGSSSGSPSEEGIKIDVEDAFILLNKSKNINKDKIFIFGKSLGANLAIHLSNKYHKYIKGIILENAFLNLSLVIDYLYPYLKLMRPYLVQLKWDNEDQIKEVKTPILFIYGTNDSTVPNWHSKKLKELAINSPSSSLYEVEGGNHYDCNIAGGEDYYSSTRSFINENLPLTILEKPEEIKAENISKNDA